MKSLATPQFWARLAVLPEDVQKTAREAYALWQSEPHHRGLAFKRVHPKLPLWPVRIGMHWRAVGERDGDTITWFWIGSHSDYDKLLSRR